jgi:[ribosomal protein S5]-alanine N-acetyltransferase
LWDDEVIHRDRVVEAVESHLTGVASHRIGYWMIEKTAGPHTAGFCGFRFLDNSKEIELLYGLLLEHWGQGLATEAAQAALDFGAPRPSNESGREPTRQMLHPLR